MMNGNSTVVDETGKTLVKKLAPLRPWNENTGESELEVVGTPRTPRTSTTPGIIWEIY